MDEDLRLREQEDEKMINDAFQKVLNDYMASRHRKKVDIITKAFNFAKQAHKGVRRLSGEPYIMHPIAVAQIVCSEIGLGSTSICAALLHDVVEDTDYTVEDIDNMFGEKIAQIVNGLTKISGNLFGKDESAQAENFKKLILTMNEDIRVILIKIADRLHNMRTLEAQPANKKYKIGGETLYIYAPLAHRLGLYKIKSELENLSFKYDHPDTYNSIVSKLALTQAERDELFHQFTAPIREVLDKMKFSYEIIERVKTPYSIWKKMNKKKVTFEEIYDILAVRIIYKPHNREHETADCMMIYDALCKLYEQHPDRIRDWVHKAKSNGYRAYHVTLMSKQGKWIEVQIRSDIMDEVDERGFAAHWSYKEGPQQNDEEKELNNWLDTIKEILSDPHPDAMDFLDSIKLNLFSSEITVFTPKGEMVTMPSGSTVLDFAYNIHTFLGSHCMAAKINHKLTPLSHRLKTGDQVEILASQSQSVKPEWINFATTAKARSKVMASIRRQNRDMQKVGENIIQKFMAEKELRYSLQEVDKLAKFHGLSNREEFLLGIGQGTIILGDQDVDELKGKHKNKENGGNGWRRYVPFVKTKKAEEPKPEEKITVPEKFNKKKPIFITEENITKYNFPPCCRPIPGDDILGYIDNKNHIDIHKRACPVAARLKTSYGNRILDAKWDMHRQLFFDATIQLRGIDRMGLVNEVTKVISEQMNVNIRKLMFTSDEGIFDGKIDLRVHDREEVQKVLNNLKQVADLEETSMII